MARLELNLLALVKDSGDRYFFVFDDESLPLLQQTLGRFATTAGLDFNWYDAAILSRRAQEMIRAKDPGGDLSA